MSKCHLMAHILLSVPLAVLEFPKFQVFPLVLEFPQFQMFPLVMEFLHLLVLHLHLVFLKPSSRPIFVFYLYIFLRIWYTKLQKLQKTKSTVQL